MELQRAYSLFQIKSVDEVKREIRGIATTPETDRYGDVVESLGAQFALPLPLLSQHNATKPVGHVTAASLTKEGIPVTTRLVKPAPDDPKSWSERLEEAWADVRSGLVRGFSIGFKPIEWSIMEETGGYRFLKWDWLELSLVTIPANAGATISTIKSIDRQLRGVSALPRRPVRLVPFHAGVTAKNADSRPGAVKLNTGVKP